MGDSQPNKGGQPTKYRAVFCRQAEKLCLLGATDPELADFFGVCRATINNWKKAHPRFLDALKGAKNDADTRVERSLFERAIGYEHPEDKIFMFKAQPVVVPTTKHYPPDTTAGMFWLQNRQPARWRNVKYMDVTSKGEKIQGVPPTDAELLKIAMSGK